MAVAASRVARHAKYARLHGTPCSLPPQPNPSPRRRTRCREASANPFNVPGDDEIFRHREEDKTRRLEERMAALAAPVADKSTFASRMQATTTNEARELLRKLRAPAGGPKAGPTIASSTLVPELRKEKENMADFIAKKREIFLLQMSLDTKRAEIKKLDERARQREEALKKSEQMLEEDALRFDAFLKENDEKVQEAIKRAEVEAKAKQDKVGKQRGVRAQETASCRTQACTQPSSPCSPRFPLPFRFWRSSGSTRPLRRCAAR